MFQEKLGSQDEYAFALAQCESHGINVRNLLSLTEWKEMGEGSLPLLFYCDRISKTKLRPTMLGSQKAPRGCS
jgi:hypothetical protein